MASMNSPTLNYHNLLVDIKQNGHTSFNDRTGKNVTTVLNKTFTYDSLPLVASKKVAVKSAVAEMLGYLKGLRSAKDFRALGTKTWDANANSPVWQQSQHCRGEDDMGRVYGVQGREWRVPTYGINPAGYHRGTDGYLAPVNYVDPLTESVGKLDQLAKIINNLMHGTDDRGEILSFWNPGEFHMGCLRPCMLMHQFSLLGSPESKTLHLTSYQRSADVPLGLPFNMIQTWFLLSLMAAICGHKVGTVTHHIVNAHIYEDQWDGVDEQISRIGDAMVMDARNSGRDVDFSFFGIPDGGLANWMDALGYIDGMDLSDVVFPDVEMMTGIEFPFSV